jgi:hypothetical protein
MELREARRNTKATEIQSIVRGLQARKRFIRVKMEARKVHLTVCMQRDYRRRLSQTHLLAMRRDKAAELRFRAARAQRGKLLRALGFAKRKQQAVFGIVLNGMGIDPLTYVHRTAATGRLRSRLVCGMLYPP